jgi:hypothetical protein
VRSQLFELALVRAYPFFGPLGGRESAELTGWTISEGGIVTMKPGPRLQKSTVKFILIQGPFFKQTSAPAPLFEADLMAELSSVHDRIDDLRDRFLDRIHAPGVPRGVLQPDRVRPLRHEPARPAQTHCRYSRNLFVRKSGSRRD